MTVSLFLDGETPSKKNSRVTDTRTGRTFPNVRYRNWEKDAVLEIKRQYHGEPIEGPVTVDIIFNHADKRVRDCDNPVNSICDMLKKAGVLKDDRWTVIPYHRILHRLSEQGAGCEIVIKDFEGVCYDFLVGFCKK
jgi:Holliday junction resolvase RusA-like endonuclease